MTNRRELLKYFGAGALIAPVMGGPAGTLIEAAKVELFRPPEVTAAISVDLASVEEVAITLRLKSGGRHVLTGTLDRPSGRIDNSRELRAVINFQTVGLGSPETYRGAANGVFFGWLK